MRTISIRGYDDFCLGPRRAPKLDELFRIGARIKAVDCERWKSATNSTSVGKHRQVDFKLSAIKSSRWIRVPNLHLMTTVITRLAIHSRLRGIMLARMCKLDPFVRRSAGCRNSNKTLAISETLICITSPSSARRMVLSIR